MKKEYQTPFFQEERFVTVDIMSTSLPDEGDNVGPDNDGQVGGF